MFESIITCLLPLFAIFIFILFLLYRLSGNSRTEINARITQLEQDVTQLERMLTQRDVDSFDTINIAAQVAPSPLQHSDTPLAPPTPPDSPVVDKTIAHIPENARTQPRKDERIDESIPMKTFSPLPPATPLYPLPHLSPAASDLSDSAIAETTETTENTARKRATVQAENETESEWSLPLIGWFLRSNVLVQIGTVILFFGIGFLLKYVADLGLLSLGMRHVAVAASGIAISVIGWLLRKKERFYGLALQGAGLGILYLTTFFAFRIYYLIPAAIAFPVLVALGVLCAGLAVINDARVLAFLAVIGAFLAPILASTDSGSHVMLFSYYAVVNVAILAVAWFKAWRSLNLASFFFTLAAGLLWGLSSYTRELLSSTEPFVILFFGFFLVIAILYGLRRATDPTAQHIDLIDTTLVFGNPFAIFAIQSIIMQPIENGVGISTAAMGLIYGAVSIRFLLRDSRTEANHHPLTEAFLFLSFFFLALSVPLLVEPTTTTATWAVTGAIWVWMGTQRQRTWTRLFGLLVQLGAGVFFVWDFGIDTFFSATVESIPFMNATYVGTLLLAGSGLFSAYQLWRGKVFVANLSDEESSSAEVEVVNRIGRWPAVSALVLTWALGWWFGGGIMQIVDLFMPYDFVNSIERLFSGTASSATIPANLWTTILLFIAGSAALFEACGRGLRWHTLRRPMILLLPVLALFSIIQLAYVPHHFAGMGWLIWPIVVFLYYWILFQQQVDFGSHLESDGNETKYADAPSGFSWAHAGTFWLLTFILTWFAGWFVNKEWASDTWMISAVATVPSLFIFALSVGIDQFPRFMRTHKNTYLGIGICPIALFVLGWSLLGFGSSSGGIDPVAYIPLLNPLDLSQVVVFAALFVWLRKHEQPTRTMLGRSWGMLGFIAFNLLIARTVHHTMAVPFTWDELFYFGPLQMIYSVLWGALALLLMFWSRRNGQRILWGSGALILALTIAKLFLVDLANSDSIARIVSFIGVGLLVMIIAYFAPAPQGKDFEEPTILSDSV